LEEGATAGGEPQGDGASPWFFLSQLHRIGGIPQKILRLLIFKGSYMMKTADLLSLIIGKEIKGGEKS
jgi:hypothetical protein